MIFLVEGVSSWILCILDPRWFPLFRNSSVVWYFLLKDKRKFLPDLANDRFFLLLLKHEIWLPLQSGLTFTACIVNNSFFLSHSVWLCDLSQKWIPNTEHALENGDGNFLILEGRSIELGEFYSEFSINANLAGPERRYPKSFGKHLPHLWNHTSKSQSGNQYSFLFLCELEELESIVLVSSGWRKAAFGKLLIQTCFQNIWYFRWNQGKI